jgi:hypothetical protein
MKRLVISLIVWAVAVTGLFFSARVPQPQVTPQEPDKDNAAQQLRTIHQQIVIDTILY